jgi:hypothetical protein
MAPPAAGGEGVAVPDGPTGVLDPEPAALVVPLLGGAGLPVPVLRPVLRGTLAVVVVTGQAVTVVVTAVTVTVLFPLQRQSVFITCVRKGVGPGTY